MTLLAAPFTSVPMLLLAPADSHLRMFLEEAHRLITAEPKLLAAVDADLDAHGKRKKAVRQADARWAEARSQPLPGLAAGEPVDPTTLTLGVGRPRTSAYVVVMFLLLRGYAGGFKVCEVTSLMMESITIHVFLRNHGISMPGRSTLTELVNAVRNETRSLLLDAQVRQALADEFDDFDVMLQDSTAVEGNVAWPTDSRTIVALVERMLRTGAALARVGLTAFEARPVQRLLAAMDALDREIDLSTGNNKGKKVERARTRRRRYTKLLAHAGNAHALLLGELARVAAECAALDVAPSRRAIAERTVQRLREDLRTLAQVIENCTRRVVGGEKIPMAEKVLSTSDPDVGFIAKGQRDPVIGYKPQLARSRSGFITGLLLPQGNAADSGQLEPMLKEVVRRTGKTPQVVSLDDGYASAANMALLKQMKIEVRSINGSKGKKLTAKRDWDRDEYAEARDLRSAIESLMFTIKQGFGFGVVARRGLQNVYGELLEKALAYNLCQRMRIRLARESQERDVDDDPLDEAMAA